VSDLLRGRVEHLSADALIDMLALAFARRSI
jgi:hypothetical protein